MRCRSCGSRRWRCILMFLARTILRSRSGFGRTHRCCRCCHDRSALCLLSITLSAGLGFLSALTKYSDFKFAHRPFQSQQHAVVQQAGIVNTLGIDHDRFC